MDLKGAERLLKARDRAQRKHQAQRRAALSLGHAIQIVLREYRLRIEQINLDFGSGGTQRSR